MSSVTIRPNQVSNRKEDLYKEKVTLFATANVVFLAVSVQ